MFIKVAKHHQGCYCPGQHLLHPIADLKSCWVWWSVPVVPATQGIHTSTCVRMLRPGGQPCVLPDECLSFKTVSLRLGTNKVSYLADLRHFLTFAHTSLRSGAGAFTPMFAWVLGRSHWGPHGWAARSLPVQHLPRLPSRCFHKEERVVKTCVLFE